MSEQDAISKAQDAVGTSDTIRAAAWMEPRGTSGGMLGGSIAGGAVGGAFGTAGSVAGVGVGGGAGMGEARAHDDDVASRSSGHPQSMPYVTLLAVGDGFLHAWEAVPHGIHRAAGRELFRIGRADARTESHERMNVRTFEVVDTTTGARWEFESNRFTGHLGPVLDALGMR